MTAKVKDRPTAATAYDADFHAWLLHQAAMLRAGQLTDLDAENIAEELEGMARTEFRSLVAALKVLVMHMLKWDQQSEFRTRSWVHSIREQRERYAALLEDNPSLKPRRDEALVKAYRLARNAAAYETQLDDSDFPRTCPYDWDNILSRPFDYDSVPNRT